MPSDAIDRDPRTSVVEPSSTTRRPCAGCPVGPAPLVTGGRSGEAAPAGGEARLHRRHLPSDRLGLRREQAGRGRARGDRRDGPVLLRGAVLLPHQPDQRSGRPAVLDAEQPPGHGPPPRHRRLGVRHPRAGIMFGGKNSLIVGFAAALAATVFGVVYGAVSGFFGGWVDALHDADRRHPAVDPAALPPHRPGRHLPHVAPLLIIVHRLRGLAGAGPAHPGRDADAAGARVRPGRAGHGGQPVAGSSSATSSPTPSAPSS